jgi:hypothetical protein
MIIAVMIVAVTVELTASEPITTPTVIADGTPVHMEGGGTFWRGALASSPSVIHATFEDLTGNQGTAMWDASWTPTPTSTPEPTHTSTPTATPEPTHTPTLTPTPPPWQTTDGFGWKYSREVLEVTHAYEAGHAGFYLDDGYSEGERDGDVIRTSWKTLSGRHRLTYEWRENGKTLRDSAVIIFLDSGTPLRSGGWQGSATD